MKSCGLAIQNSPLTFAFDVWAGRCPQLQWSPIHAFASRKMFSAQIFAWASVASASAAAASYVLMDKLALFDSLHERHKNCLISNNMDAIHKSLKHIVPKRKPPLQPWSNRMGL
eukprot:8686419-Karenia_brevis.AAC.1